MAHISHCNTGPGPTGFGAAERMAWPPARDLHTDASRRRTPQAVMVCPVFRGALVWVRHAQRGWELPGGKVEPGEDPAAAARREAWEEAGLRLGELVWIAEYAYDLPARSDSAAKTQIKWVYAAPVEDAGARPAESETLDVRVFRPVPTPEEVQAWPDASPIMRDAVYPLVWRLLIQRGWISQENSPARQ